MEDDEHVRHVCRDFESSKLSEPEKALFRYLAVVNDTPWKVAREHVEQAKAAGWSEAALYDAVTVCAIFNFFNRWIDGTGVEDVPPGFYEDRLRDHGSMGYAM